MNVKTRLAQLERRHPDARRVLYLTDHGDGTYTDSDGRTLSQAAVDGRGYPVKVYEVVSPDDWDAHAGV